MVRLSRLQKCLAALAAHQGALAGGPPAEPWRGILWRNAVAPMDEARREAAFAALDAATGCDAERIAALDDAAWARICGTSPAARAQAAALRACAERRRAVGDPAALLDRPDAAALLQQFPGIDAAAAAQVLLFAGAATRLALDGHALRTLVRIGYGLDEHAGNYGQRLDPWRQHESAVDAAEQELGDQAGERIELARRLHRHGLERCTRRPQCARCPIANLCDLARLIGKNR